MNTTSYSTLGTKASSYVALQRQMHDALRAQHPEWISSNGDSATCDSYELRLAHLLSLSLESEREYAQ